MNVGIIGGGALGLAAAYDLLKRGHTAAVFERAPILGGQASTFNVGGGRLERGYHHLFRSDRYMVDLIHELGLGDKLAWIPSKVGFFYDSKIYPFTTPMDLLRFKPLSFFERVKLGLVTYYLQKQKYWPRKYEGITAAAWMKKNVGQHIYDVTWGPLLRGKFGARAEEVGMVWLWGKIYLRTTSRKGFGRETLGYPLGSWGEVFDTLEARIRSMGGEIHYPVTVSKVLVENGRAAGLRYQFPDKPEETRRFDAILSTTPSYLFPNLVPELPDDYKAMMQRVTYQAAILIVMVLDRPLSWTYWLNIADRSLPFVGVIEHTNFIDKERYGGNHIVYISNYIGQENEMYRMSPDDLWKKYIPALQKVNPAFQESWVKERFYHRENAAQPIIGVNYSKQIPPHKTPIEGLWLANTTQIYPEDRGTNYSVKLGQEIAKIIAP
jgi:protoporphyrinogen oxidase